MGDMKSLNVTRRQFCLASLIMSGGTTLGGCKEPSFLASPDAGAVTDQATSKVKNSLPDFARRHLVKTVKLEARPKALQLINAARRQIGVTRIYDPAYIRLDYPNGDIDRLKGVCSDVIIRAYRDAFDFDLQKALHEDMREDFFSYPDRWGLERPDKNIDHRRVPNLETYFKRQEAFLGRSLKAEDYQPGDLITQRLNGLPHIVIVSNKAVKKRDGRLIPMVIHNVGRGTREEDISHFVDAYGAELHPQQFRFFPGV